MFMGMTIAVDQFYCARGKVAIPVNGSCYYTIVRIVRQEKVITIANRTNCMYMYTTFPTIVLCFTYKCPDKITGIEWEKGRGSWYRNCVTWLVLT